MKNILICGSWRCGSTMVCEDLTNTGQLGFPEEHTSNWKYDPGTDWPAELARLRERSTTANGVFSTKLMAAHITTINRCLAGAVAPGPSPLLPNLVGAFPDATWVWVRRRDTLLQAISSYVAVSTGKYHLIDRNQKFRPGAATPTRPDTIPYDYSEIMRHWQILQMHSKLWEEFFTQNGITPLTVWYEDAAEAPVAGQIAEAAGVTLSDYDATRKLRKIADSRSDDVRSRLVDEMFAK